MKHKVGFTHSVHVTGNLGSSFSFRSEAEMKKWIASEFPKLKKQYDTIGQQPLTYSTRKLEILKIGDQCHVVGDGDETYTILDVVSYSPNRWGIALDSGCTEEVHKCYPIRH